MRLLKTYESQLIQALLMTSSKYAEEMIPTLNTLLVEDVDDGGMGGLFFISPSDNSDRSLGKTIAEAEFLDEDGIPVSVALNLDTNNQLFELDVWKVDYSPVSKWPDLGRIAIEGV
jgi:hypothetical protein